MSARKGPFSVGVAAWCVNRERGRFRWGLPLCASARKGPFSVGVAALCVSQEGCFRCLRAVDPNQTGDVSQEGAAVGDYNKYNYVFSTTFIHIYIYI